ncbi:hypothetical protein AB0M43_23710 [Longispora sp. NPDC051575]|uniref:hypothetical protein n=1 Tax=Longispora sp. NPDC051575 TaxID=3154943 RepID=UPI00343CE31A
MAYKSTRDRSVARPFLLAFIVLCIGALVFLAGRWTAPAIPSTATTPTPAGTTDPAESGPRFDKGVPVGFPGTAQGAGEAAAAFESARAAWKGLSRDEVRSRLVRIAAPSLIDQLMPDPLTVGNPNLTIAAPLLVTTSQGRSRQPVADGTHVTAKVYALAAIGPRGTGVNPPVAGLAGGFTVSTLGLRWSEGSWQIVSYALGVAAPIVIDPAGTAAAMPVDLVGPAAWVPGTPLP